MKILEEDFDDEKQMKNILKGKSELRDSFYEEINSKLSTNANSDTEVVKNQLLNKLDMALESVSSDVLFQYKKIICKNSKDNLCDFSFKVLVNGQIIYNYHSFLGSGSESVKTYMLDSKTLLLLKNEIDCKMRIINLMPDHLNAYIKSENEQIFKFYDKEITASDIKLNDIEKSKNKHFNYFSKIKSIITYNKLLRIFNKITKILRNEPFVLTLQEFTEK